MLRFEVFDFWVFFLVVDVFKVLKVFCFWKFHCFEF